MVCVLGLCWFSGFVAGGFGTDSVGGVFVAGDRLVVVHGLCWQLWVVVFSLRPLPFLFTFSLRFWFFNWIFDARFFECCFFLKHCFGVLLGWFFAYSTLFLLESLILAQDERWRRA